MWGALCLNMSWCGVDIGSGLSVLVIAVCHEVTANTNDMLRQNESALCTENSNPTQSDLILVEASLSYLCLHFLQYDILKKTQPCVQDGLTDLLLF